MPEKAREILSYFMRNPRAADSLEGVVRWRLLQEKIHQDVEETRRALAWLVSHGFLSQESPTGADPIFCLNTEKTSQAERFLTEAQTTRKRRADRA